jgi:hypothetical protein
MKNNAGKQDYVNSAFPYHLFVVFLCILFIMPRKMDSPTVIALTIIGILIICVTYIVRQVDARKEEKLEKLAKEADSIAAEKDKAVKARSGEIKNEAATEIRTVKLVPRGSGVMFITPQLQSAFNTLQNDFKVYAQGKKLMVDATLRDTDGKPIGNITRNIFSVPVPGYDYNNDSNAFEIVTPDNAVLFQIELIGETAYFAGLMTAADGGGIYLYPDIGGVGMNFYSKEPKFSPPKGLIKPIFKYPREMFFGKREE